MEAVVDTMKDPENGKKGRWVRRGEHDMLPRVLGSLSGSRYKAPFGFQGS